MGGSLQYADGALAMGLAAQKVQTAFSSGEETAWQLGASYDFGPVKVFGQVGRIEEDDTRTGSAVAAGWPPPAEVLTQSEAQDVPGWVEQ